jgi:hypothetical protein
VMPCSGADLPDPHHMRLASWQWYAELERLQRPAKSPAGCAQMHNDSFRVNSANGRVDAAAG